MSNIEKLKMLIQLYKEKSEINDKFIFLGENSNINNFFNFGDDFESNYRKKLLNRLENLDYLLSIIDDTKGFSKATRTKAVNSLKKDKKIAKRYQKTFSFLAQEINPTNFYKILEERLYTVLKDENYKLHYWKITTYAEVLSKLFPNNLVRFNNLNRTVSDYLNLEYKNSGSDIKQYISFQKEVAKPCFELYKKPNLNNIKDVPTSTLINDFFGFVYKEQIKNSAIEKDNINSIIHAKIKKLSIQNYYCIDTIILSKFNNEVYIVGENGVGKTLLLQAIFWIAKRLLIENDPENTLGTAWVKRNFNQLKNLKIRLETSDIGDNIYKYPNEVDEISKHIKNFFAYGVNRQYQKGNEDTYEFMSLFNSEVPTSLRNPENWLIKKYNAKFRKKTNGRLSYEKIVSFLEHLLDDKIKISIVEGKNDSLKVIFREQDTNNIEFNLLSDGYKSVFTLLTDLLSRLAENQPNAEKIEDFKGVVLIDELDLFLHPKWSYNIVRKLRSKLPNIQFIITTHSPMLILGAGKDAIFYRMYKEEGLSKILGPIENKNLTDKMANHIVTAPFLFDLSTARQAAFDDKKQEVDTSDDYLASVIHKAIEKRLEKELKANLTEANIWKIANELLEQELKKR